MILKNGFTLIELLVAIAIIGVLSGVTVMSVTSSIVKAEDVRRVTDVKAIAGYLEEEKGFYGQEYITSASMPESIGDVLYNIPEHNTTNDGKYSWFDNISSSDIYCLWATLGDDDVLSQKKYYVANQFGVGYFESEPTSLNNCGYYVDDSEGNEWYDGSGDEESEEDEEIPDDTDRVYVCHLNKKGKGKTLLVSQNGAQAHLNHGDYLGECIE